MSVAKEFALIAVRDGSAGDVRWISMDGAAETCNPEAFLAAFPQLSCVVLDGDFSESAQQLTSLVAQQIDAADVCLVNSSELLAFTKKENVYREILSGAIDRLPNLAQSRAPIEA